MNFHGEERDLPLVVFLVVEKTVAADAPARHAFNFGNFPDLMPARRPAVTSQKIMSGRNVKMTDPQPGGAVLPTGSSGGRAG
jgi:hypothetical protein